MARLSIADQGILYINPDPAHRHVSAFFPHVVQLSEKGYVCTYQRGDGMYALNCRIALLRSTDGGVTWADEGCILESAAEGGRWSLHDGFLKRMTDGRLSVLAFRADRSRRPTMFSDAGGIIENEPFLAFSEDDGRTWTDPQPFALPEGMVATPTNGIVELADGRWMAAFDQWRGYDDPRPYRPCMWAFFSGDGGRTWTERVKMAEDRGEGKGYWHGKTIRLADDRLFTMFWTADMTQPEKGPVNLPLHSTISPPDGSDWPAPVPTSIPGQTNWPAQLPDGSLALIYTLREAERPGFFVVHSLDGKTWDLENQVRLWDCAGWETIGIGSPDKYPRSHDTVAFGAPTLIATREGDLFAAWWCTYASVTHCRWARVRIGR